ncbi:MAG: uroporphyrinogen-III C-methyltransferase [Aestuariivita sp.]|nr:uroporphyrinogen-III C-methyltransferase [Aestuariivita sp.]
MAGFVSFVGSGPGDPDLLTLKAVKCLQKADAVLFDDLSAGPILAHVRKEADLIGVGKRAGRTSPDQRHVSRLLVDCAKLDQRVVRLKSGDSGLFGRLEEELLALREAKIPFEIIPGVPSACAAAAEAGIPLTRRLAARRVQFITGHDIKGTLPDDFNMSSLTDPMATTVVFMGRRTFPDLVERLIAHGLPADTPAILAEGISGSNQQIDRGPITEIAQRLNKDGGNLPAVIFYGPLLEY